MEDKVIGERIRVVRKKLGLSQEEFGKRLGLTRGAIVNAELGRATIKPLFIEHICETFQINENWITNGEGEMFVKMDPDEEFAKLMVEMQASNDEFIINALKAYWELPEEHKQVVKDLIKKIAGK